MCGRYTLRQTPEEVAEKPAFGVTFRKCRCLVRADGLYDWQEQGSGSKLPRPMDNDRPFTFAGHWKECGEQETGRLPRFLHNPHHGCLRSGGHRP